MASSRFVLPDIIAEVERLIDWLVDGGDVEEGARWADYISEHYRIADCGYSGLASVTNVPPLAKPKLPVEGRDARGIPLPVPVTRFPREAIHAHLLALAFLLGEIIRLAVREYVCRHIEADVEGSESLTWHRTR